MEGKKGLIIGLIVAVVLIGAIVIVAISNNNKPSIETQNNASLENTTNSKTDTTSAENESNSNTQTTKASDNAITAILGSWKYQGADFTYTFNEDGTGNYNAVGTDMKFKYTIEGNQISILYEGSTAPFETKYSIDGDTLNVIDSLGNDTLYKKVK